jgi:YegS/Rv2252/BmrU family lipid kinase
VTAELTARPAADPLAATSGSPPADLPRARRGLLIVNPRAGARARSDTVAGVVAEVGLAGWPLDVRETLARGDATTFAAEAAAQGRPFVLVAGGDGTLNEAIQGLAGSATAVGQIPLGTVNIWTRELGLSHDPVQAARELVAGEVRRIDLGRANGRYFLLMAGLGFDAEAIHAVEGEPKRRFGPAALFLVGALAALRSPGTDLRVRADDQTFETSSALVTIGNTRLWAGAVEITHHATAADGLLDVCFFPGRSVFSKLRHLALVLLGRHDAAPDVTYMQVRQLLIVARPAMPLQIDGEPFGTTPARVEVVPGAIRALVGRGDAPIVAGALPESLDG